MILLKRRWVNPTYRKRKAETIEQFLRRAHRRGQLHGRTLNVVLRHVRDLAER